MPAFSDRVKETTTTTGTGALTLLGAVSQFQSFVNAFPNNPIIVAYAIVGQSGTEWEIGKGTFTGPSTLARDIVVRSSSNANALVSLSAGTKDVFVTPSAEHIDNANIGLILAQQNGWAMP